MVRLAAQYDLGLCSEPGHTWNNRIALTNKLFTYMLAGVPPVMSDIPAQVSLAETSGLADLIYRRGDPPALAALLDHLLGNAERLAAFRARVWKDGQRRWNWEAEAPALVDAVRSAIGPVQQYPSVQAVTG
jgi:hypothetical protein